VGPDPSAPDAVLDPPRAAVVDAVGRALAEDLLPLGDLTSALIPEAAEASIAIVSRQEGVIAGRACALEAFAQIDPAVLVEWCIVDGGPVAPGQVVARASGSLRSLLTAERTVLNFLGHLSGVATLTHRFVSVVQAANPATRVLDTRKTTPGLRALEKAAEAILVKDNHLAGTSITDAVARATDRWPGRMVEVECDRADQVAEAVAAGATVVMLDNMGPEEVARCVALVRASGRGPLVEVSGGVTLDSVGALAAAGVDLVSVGALTHSAPVLDLGFDLAPDAGAGVRG